MEIITPKSSMDIVDLTRPILVSMESFQALTDMKVVSDDGMRWHVTLMSFDKLSRNNNLYPADDTIKSFAESTFIQENLRNRTLYGEAEHPPADASLARFLSLEPTRYAWNILSIENKGDRFEGDVCLCDPLGTSIILPNIKRFGSNYASSCRIYTPNFVKKSGPNGKYYIKKYRMHPITFDCVGMPGLVNCRLIDGNAYQPGKVDTSVESTRDILFTNPEETIKEMLKSSESAKVLSDYVGADLANSACIVGKNKVRYSTEDGIQVDIPLNQHLLNELFK